MKTKLFIAMAFLMILATSCKLNIAVSKSVASVAYINSISTAVDAVYNSAKESTDKSYPVYVKAYGVVNTLVDSLIASDQVRKNPNTIIAMDQTVKMLLLKFQHEHSGITANNAVISTWQRYAQSAIAIRKNAENHSK
jgi:hypothetical protein